MKTKDEVKNHQEALKKPIPEHSDLLKDVSAQQSKKAIPHPKPVTPEPSKQPEPVKAKIAALIKATPKQSQQPTNTTGAKMEPTLYVQVTPANPRCGVPALTGRVISVMGLNPKNGDIFAFTDRWNKTIQVLQETQSGSSLLKKKLVKATQWPGFSAGNKTGPVVLKGKAKEAFLKKLGCPIDLSK